MLDQLLAFIAILGWLWFVVFVASVTLHAYRAGGPRQALRSFVSFRIMIGLLVVIGLSLLSASLVFIEPQEAAVVVSIISPNGYREQPLRSGLRMIVPLAERVVRYPIYWQTYTMSSDVQEGAKAGNDAITARTSDGQVVYLDSSIIYRIDPNEVIRVHIDLQNRYVEDFIRPVMRGVIRTEVSQFTADEINSSRRKNLEANLEDLLRTALSDKGFILDRFLLRNIAFSTAYASAIELKQVAEQDRIQREYQAEQIRKLAEGERDRQKIEAEGRAAAIEREAQAKATATVLQARADAEALRLINQALQRDPSLLQYRYIDKLSPNIRVMLLPNNTPLLLPLPDLTGDLGVAGGGAGVSPTITGTITNTLTIPAVVTTPTPSPTATPTGSR
jgi:regulator of protease activity HflC (stomatin/prohibitin superfamily)